MNEKLPQLRKKAMSLPLTPGVYLMKNKQGVIIYVGKAKALKNRVSQYFGSQNNHAPKVRKMVENVDDFDYILCDSEFEALVLECSLIKQHSPKYNILLKDDKGYSYIKVTNGEWKNFFPVKQKDDPKAEYIGPFMSSFGITNAVDSAKKIFKIPSCGKVFPRDYGKSRPCLNYSIGQCSAPCAGKITAEAHNEAVDRALELITGGSDSVVESLTRRMNAAAENLEFEKAAKLRDTINAVRKITDKQKVVAADVPEQDVFAIVGAGDSAESKACLSVLRFKESRLYDSEYFIIDLPDDLPRARSEMIRYYYSIRDFVPKRVTVDGEVDEAELLSLWLSAVKSGEIKPDGSFSGSADGAKPAKKVTVFVPQRGGQKSVVDMCRSNAAQKLAIYMGRTGRGTAALDELGRALGLKAPPAYIESYDISHTAGSNNVAGMIVFKNGLPFKKAYKRFTIKGFSGQDDYASMAEVLDRRFTEYEQNKDSGEGFGRLPDLILLDGGKGQVNAVLPVMKAHGLSIPLFGMVKDSHHRTRAIATGGEEISLTSKRAAFTLVSTIQEEVHRYSIAYHRQKSRSSAVATTLTRIDGIGEARAKALMKHFKTVKAISEASAEEIAKVKGMSLAAAEKVYDAFHGEE